MPFIAILLASNSVVNVTALFFNQWAAADWWRLGALTERCHVGGRRKWQWLRGQNWCSPPEAHRQWLIRITWLESNQTLDLSWSWLSFKNKDGFVRARSHANTSWTWWSFGNLIECSRSPLDQCKAMSCKAVQIMWNIYDWQSWYLCLSRGKHRYN